MSKNEWLNERLTLTGNEILCIVCAMNVYGYFFRVFHCKLYSFVCLYTLFRSSHISRSAVFNIVHREQHFEYSFFFYLLILFFFRRLSLFSYTTMLNECACFGELAAALWCEYRDSTESLWINKINEHLCEVKL